MMTKEDFDQVTAVGNFVAWQNNLKGTTVPTIALMVGKAWFATAINCDRDSQMGEPDADGVYSRIWMADEVSLGDNPRLATHKEVFLYLHKVGGLSSACGSPDISARTVRLVVADSKGHYRVEGLDETSYGEFPSMAQQLHDMSEELTAAKKGEVEAYVKAFNEAIGTVMKERDYFLTKAAANMSTFSAYGDDATLAIMLHKLVSTLRQQMNMHPVDRDREELYNAVDAAAAAEK